MHVPRVEYLRWAKALPDCAFQLASSGVPSVSTAELDFDAGSIELASPSFYGLETLTACIATTYGTQVERVLPLPGTTTANFFALTCAFERGDRVLMELPVYEPLRRAAEFLGIDVQFIHRDPSRDFAIPLDAVQRGLANGARGLVFSNLHNPSGVRCPTDDLHALSSMIGDAGAFMVVDEVYLDLATRCRGDAGWTAASLGDHVLTTNSLTKVYGLGGLRTGWLIAGESMIDRARSLMDHVHGANPLPSEQLGAIAFERLDRLTQRSRRLCEEGHRIVSDWLISRNDIHGYPSAGASFALLRLETGIDGDALGRLLIEEYDTLVVPGSFFDLPDHIRLGIAIEPTILAEGLRRIGIAIERLRTSINAQPRGGLSDHRKGK